MGWGPKAPDTTAANTAATSSAKISQEQWDWTKARQPKIDEQTDAMISMGRDQYKLNREGQEFQQGLMRRYDDRFWNTQAPLQDSMVRDAMAFNVEGRQAELAAQAMADVGMAFEQAKQQQTRGLERSGYAPDSGKALVLGQQASLAEAKAKAGAFTKTREAARLEGYSLKTDANAMLAGLSGFSSTAGSLSAGFGGTAMQGGGMGMSGLASGGTQFYAGANGSSAGLMNASGGLRANAIESARRPGFDAVMGLAAGGMKMAGSTYGGTGWGA